VFASLDSLLEFVTKRWLRHCVLTDIRDELMLEALSRRPFFFLVVVDAPVLTRWHRCQQRSAKEGQDPPSLEQFVQRNDEMLNQNSSNIAKIMHRAEMRIMNSSQSIDVLYRGLEALKLVDDERLRPSWDQYFMRLASLAAQRSNCMKRRVGCVLVREKRVISTGYNGTPRHVKNCNQGGCE
jgi:dCMP deaminase